MVWCGMVHIRLPLCACACTTTILALPPFISIYFFILLFPVSLLPPPSSLCFWQLYPGVCLLSLVHLSLSHPPLHVCIPCLYPHLGMSTSVDMNLNGCEHE